MVWVMTRIVDYLFSFVHAMCVRVHAKRACMCIGKSYTVHMHLGCSIHVTGAYIYVALNIHAKLLLSTDVRLILSKSLFAAKFPQLFQY
jgi:hypothetical protein